MENDLNALRGTTARRDKGIGHCLGERALFLAGTTGQELHSYYGHGQVPSVSAERPGGRPEMRHHLIGKSMHHLKRLSGALAVAAGRQDLVDAELSIDRQAVDELGARANEKVLGEFFDCLRAW